MTGSDQPWPASPAVGLALPVQVRQGGSSWPQELRQLSLESARTTRPERWDAQYNEPFTLHLSADGRAIELHAYLQQVGDAHLEFTISADRDNLAPLYRILESHCEDREALEAAYERLLEAGN